jgi:hypothetical protein
VLQRLGNDLSSIRLDLRLAQLNRRKDRHEWSKHVA